ncbi:putative clathrin assembly protein At5g57200 isoform X2 [Nicotiana tomentosiformis]|uniref:putative clathrin assembly protein At5g57200 isoform X2 n=1 Tax=Nicotiana tomentosiformis TaxID=4098 RepID=UPI00051B4A51|nr:putative clathrin assembly protein At5g57200 isoform X2 [Nicotiana tomentosiformis]
MIGYFVVGCTKAYDSREEEEEEQINLLLSLLFLRQEILIWRFRFRMESFRKAYGALKDSTKVGLAKVNSDFKDLDIAIVKATNHVESPPKERHVAMIFAATSVTRPRADVAYCIHALSRRLAKTRNWIVALKTLIVIHRVLREGDPTFKEELLHFSHRGHIFQISNFKDDSSTLAWDCSAWVRTYGLFLEERLECFRTLKYDIEAERLTKTSPGISKVHSRTRLLNGEELLEQLPALQQLLYRLICCQPEGGACYNFLIQYALALVLKESFKIYCAINDGIINLVDFFFEMSKHDAIKALNIYKRAGKQVYNFISIGSLNEGLDLARTFQFPILKQPPVSFLATMEEYIREAPHTGSMSSRRLEYRETEQEPETPKEPVPEEKEEQVEAAENGKEEQVEAQEEPQPEKLEETPPLKSTEEPVDLLGLNQLDPKVAELEESNALALAIIQPGKENPSANYQLSEIGNTTRWELALVNASSNNTSQVTPDKKLAGGFDKLLLDSLYEDDVARKQIQLQNAGYSAYGHEILAQNPFNQHDPFAMSNNIAPPTNVQMAIMSQQQQQQQQVMQQQQFRQQNMMMVSHNQYQGQYPQQIPYMGSANPFRDPFGYQHNSMPPQGNQSLL